MLYVGCIDKRPAQPTGKGRGFKMKRTDWCVTMKFPEHKTGFVVNHFATKTAALREYARIEADICTKDYIRVYRNSDVIMEYHREAK
jgi:hypothetical protein